MHDMTYREKAEAALVAADKANARLRSLHDNQTAPNRTAQIADAYHQLRTQLQRAKVYATLAIADGQVSRTPRVEVTEK